MASKQILVRPIADIVGIASSLICGLHCLIIPLLLIVGPIGPLPQIEDESFHSVLLWLVIPAALIAFSLGCLQHKDRWVFAMGIIGLLSLTVSFTLLHDIVGESGERAAAAVSGLLLVSAHIRNFRLCRQCECAHMQNPIEAERLP